MVKFSLNDGDSLRFLSLFSGIEAASAAWGPLGWEAVGFSEINPFAKVLLAHRYPNVPNLGSVSEITQECVELLGKIDVVVGGFPCQDVSLAGKRVGLRNDATGETTRSGLFFDAMRTVTWAKTRWVVIENVVGLLTSKGGRDFATVVGEISGAGFDIPKSGWGNAGVVAGPRGLVEWAVLDSQYFGLAQRRRRVFIVGDFGDWSGRQPIFVDPSRLQEGSASRRVQGANNPGGNALGASGRGCAQPVAFQYTAGQSFNMGITEGLANTLIRSSVQAVAYRGSLPRRLTPLEEERLQGFEDGYTSVPMTDGKLSSDTVRYQALGNSMAVTCMRYIGERIARMIV